jgi:muramoyltetrapeptide carboxypeptidase
MKYPLLLAVLFSCIGMAPARQTPPSPSDTVQRATAALQTDNASICTPHATGAETPPTLHPDTAQPSARTQFIRPPYLRPGDTVGIVTPARKLSEKADTAKVRERFESWGLKVKFGPHTADREQPYFAGTDAQRAADLQAMIDDPGVKAVVSFQGCCRSSTSAACASILNGSSGSAM